MNWNLYHHGKLVLKAADPLHIAMVLAGHGMFDGFIVKSHGWVIFNGTNEPHPPVHPGESYDGFAALLAERAVAKRRAKQEQYLAQQAKVVARG